MSTIKTGHLNPAATDINRHVDTGDPGPEGKQVLGDVKMPYKEKGDPAFDDVGKSNGQIRRPINPSDPAGDESDDDKKKKEAEEKAALHQEYGNSVGEQTEHFKEKFPAPDDDGPPRPNESSAAKATRGLREG